jgi:hypothetical protein
MAHNPEKTHDAEATIKYENLKSTGAKEHWVEWLNFVEPWLGWSKDNRLESTWRRLPRGKRGEPAPFSVETAAVESGSGERKVKWKVWEVSTKLNNHSVELYSVMRAEKWYIKQEYTKLSSKYFISWPNKKTGQVITIENLGVDNFFWRGSDRAYVFCESKFTRDKKKYESWLEDEKNVWQLMGRYKADGKPCRQMSWEWILDRAKKAIKSPAGLAGLPQAQADSFKRGGALMLAAASRKKGTRMVNIYGAPEVPIYPGVYRFFSDETGAASNNELHVDWPFEPAKEEFIELGEKFDDWLAKQSSADDSSPAGGS